MITIELLAPIFTIAMLLAGAAYAEVDGVEPSGGADDSTNVPWESVPPGAARAEVVTDATMIDELTLPLLEYRYASFGQPDPFLPTLEAPAPKEKQFAGFEIPVVSPLQVPLGYLQVKGIWLLTSGERRALVTISPTYFTDFVGNRIADISQDEAREGYIAKVGDPIGPAGKIVSITKDSIVSRQYRILEDGTREFEDKILALRTSVEQEVKQARRSYILKPGGGVRLRARSQSVEFNKQFGGAQTEIDVSDSSEFKASEPASPSEDAITPTGRNPIEAGEKSNGGEEEQ